VRSVDGASTGVLSFRTREEMNRAIDVLDGKELEGSRISVSEDVEHNERAATRRSDNNYNDRRDDRRGDPSPDRRPGGARETDTRGGYRGGSRDRGRHPRDFNGSAPAPAGRLSDRPRDRSRSRDRYEGPRDAAPRDRAYSPPRYRSRSRERFDNGPASRDYPYRREEQRGQGHAPPPPAASRDRPRDDYRDRDGPRREDYSGPRDGGYPRDTRQPPREYASGGYDDRDRPGGGYHRDDHRDGRGYQDSGRGGGQDRDRRGGYSPPRGGDRRYDAGCVCVNFHFRSYFM
jgi:hypothetical protein